MLYKCTVLIAQADLFLCRSHAASKFNAMSLLILNQMVELVINISRCFILLFFEKKRKHFYGAHAG